MNNSKYSKKFVTLHWIHGVIIAFLLIGASLNLPELEVKMSLDQLLQFKMHIIIGIVATLLTVIRVLLAKGEKSKIEPLYSVGFKKILANANHILIYITLFIVGISGVLTASSANIGEIAIFGKDLSIYKITENTELFGEVHEFATTALIVLIVMHIVGVIGYRISTKKCAVDRMKF